ncbi:GNAT family N-acetyltransferase [Haloplanus litoreus]|uniref:GNAT family N-acetyltransferase n=1 Tax=Haloplanus litoreus TaxID=767515 RepID=UPI0036152F6D
MNVRPARVGDHEAIAAFTRETWPDREMEDYLPRTFREWAADESETSHTLVAADDGQAVGVIQGVELSDRESWVQGLRVHPDYRDRGLARRLTDAVLTWARDRNTTVCRNLVFSWNVASLGLARSLGFEPCTEFRWAEVAADADADLDLSVVADPDAGWAFWTESDARHHLRGLTIDPGTAWTLSELRPEDLQRAADADGLFVVSEGGTRGWRSATGCSRRATIRRIGGRSMRSGRGPIRQRREPSSTPSLGTPHAWTPTGRACWFPRRHDTSPTRQPRGPT